MLLTRVITYNLALAHDNYIGLFDITLFLFAFYALVFSFFLVGYHPFSLRPRIYFFLIFTFRRYRFWELVNGLVILDFSLMMFALCGDVEFCISSIWAVVCGFRMWYSDLFSISVWQLSVTLLFSRVLGIWDNRLALAVLTARWVLYICLFCCC